MSQAVLNLIAKKALKDVANKEFNAKDPFFDQVPVLDKRGQPTGKVKKVKKGIPHGVSDHDARILKTVRRRAYHLDLSLFNLCGIKFGWSAIIGLVPGIGDVIDAIMAWFLIVRKARQVEGGLPAALYSRMLFNIVLDFAIGLVPFLGDVADAWFKANTRNVWLLEDYLLKKTQAEENPQLMNRLKAEAAREGSHEGGGPRDRGDVEMAMRSVKDGNSVGAARQSSGVMGGGR